QLIRHLAGRHQILHDAVEAAAMDLPGLALHAVRQVAVRLQAEVEGYEVEGAADPGDRGHHMQPAQDQARPFRYDGSPHDDPVNPSLDAAALMTAVRGRALTMCRTDHEDFPAG